MKLKSDENNKLWESYARPRPEDESLVDDVISMDDGMEDEGFDDLGDDLDVEQDVVMEIEPVEPVEAMETNEVLVAELKKLAEYSQRLNDLEGVEFEDWMASAITIASTYVSDVWHRLDAKADFANTGVDQSDY